MFIARSVEHRPEFRALCKRRAFRNAIAKVNKVWVFVLLTYLISESYLSFAPKNFLKSC